MGYELLADAVVVFHTLFVAFVVLGGLLVLRYHKVAYAHVPAACWGAIVEYTGWICPLTPLENSLRVRSGSGGAYSGDFVTHYIIPVLYPVGLHRYTQVILGTLVIAINVAVYGFLIVQARRRRLAAA